MIQDKFYYASDGTIYRVEIDEELYNKTTITLSNTYFTSFVFVEPATQPQGKYKSA